MKIESNAISVHSNSKLDQEIVNQIVLSKTFKHHFLSDIVLTRLCMEFLNADGINYFLAECNYHFLL